MKNAILGAALGLFFGTAGALAYDHYVGDGSLLADLQAKLDEANADLAKLKSAKVELARQSSGVSEQVDALAATNADLRKELVDAKNGLTATPAPVEPNISTLAGLMMGMMRGGGGPFQQQQRLFTMQARLHLTPDQAAKIKAAMDADQQARREMMRQRFGFGRGGGGPNGGGNGGAGTNGTTTPAVTATADNLDKAVATVLTYQQQADYQKLQADEKAARAETSATSQVNGVMPLLQLTDAQKDAAMQALYQVQVNAPDPNTLIADPNPMAQIGAQAQATQAVLAKVLTPDQMTLYQEQAKAQADALAQFQGRQRGNRGGNGGGAGAPNANAGVSTTVTTAPAAPPTTTSPAPAATSPDGSTTNSTASPAATTNAAPAQ